jgi:histone acetyltransferase HTATIP
MASTNDSLVGCTVDIRTPDMPIPRQAEILQIRALENSLEYYVHYTNYNKRLDTWIPHSSLDLSTVKQPVVDPDAAAEVVPTPSKSKDKKKMAPPVIRIDGEDAMDTDDDDDEDREEREEEEEDDGIYSKEKEIKVGGSYAFFNSKETPD